ncbi:MAG: hypothetical protein ACXV5E_05180 [Halobacteriota archaeon]
MVSILIVTALILSSGCLQGGQNNQEKTPPLANSLLTVASVQAAPGFNTTLSCVLNTTNGSGLNNQTIYWSLDGKPLGQSTTRFGFSVHNLSVNDVLALNPAAHKVVAEYRGNADYAGSRGEGTLLVIQRASPTPVPTPRPNATVTPTPTPTFTPTPTITPTPTPVPTPTPTPVPTPTPTPTRSPFNPFGPRPSPTP